MYNTVHCGTCCTYAGTYAHSTIKNASNHIGVQKGLIYHAGGVREKEKRKRIKKKKKEKEKEKRKRKRKGKRKRKRKREKGKKGKKEKKGKRNITIM